MTLSRRSFFTGLSALIAAPAIVKAESLMRLAPTEIIRAPAISIRMLKNYTFDDQVVSRLDALYGYKYVRAEWAAPLALDEFSDRILAPMVDRMQQHVADAVMYGSSFSRYDGVSVKPIALSDLLVQARSPTHSIE